MGLYYTFSKHLKEKFGEKVYKITLDAGFNCPNRDGTLSDKGCIFCDASGSFSCAHDNSLSIEKQVETGIISLGQKFKAKKFFSYFQAFTNTYKPIDELKKIYDSSLKNPLIVGLSIGTRSDCVDPYKLDLIAQYQKTHYTWIEYGLQSIHNKSLEYINRGCDFENFTSALKMTQERGIKTCAHVIFGIPGETYEDMISTIKTLVELKVDGIKFHTLCALKNTRLEEIYNLGGFKAMEKEAYVNLICDSIEILTPNITIHRIAGSGLSSLLIAPKWTNRRLEIINEVEKELKKRGTKQGSKLKE